MSQIAGRAVVETAADELTSTELAFVQGLSGLSYVSGDLLYYSGSALTTLAIGTNGDYLRIGTGGVPEWTALAGAVTGPSSSTDNAIPKYDGIGGATLLDTGLIIDDSNNMTGVGTLTASGAVTVGGNVLSDTDDNDDLGSTTKEWKNLYVDGVAYIDEIDMEDNEKIKLGIGDDAQIYFNATDLVVLTDGAGASGIILDSEDDTVEIKGSGALQATFDTSGLNLVTGEAFYINSVSILNATTLGTPVVTSSLTSVGTLTDLTVTNAIAGSITGNAATVTVADESSDDSCYVAYFTAASGSLAAKTGTNLTFASSTGILTATGFAGALTGNVTGDCSGQAGTVATITGLAPDTATTQATQAAITTCANLVTVGALDSGSITSNFGAIDIGTSTLGCGAITTAADFTLARDAAIAQLTVKHHISTVGNYGAIVYLMRHNGTVASPAVIAENDIIGELRGYANDDGDTSVSEAGRLVFVCDGTPGTGDMPGRIELRTTPDGSNIPVERVRIDKAGIISMASQSRARAYLGTDQTISTATFTVVNLDTETYDSQSEFNTGTYRFTATVAGYYMVVGSVAWTSSVDQKLFYVTIREGGDTYLTQSVVHSSGTGIIYQHCSGIIYLNAAEYIELVCYQNTGGDVVIDNVSSATYMSVHKLS